MSDESPDEAYQSLYRRYRPQRFGEVRGQEHVTAALLNAVRHGRVSHAYLFSGPRGTGKTSTARILAKALNCTDLQDGEPCGVCASCTSVVAGTSFDVVELDAASNNGIDEMRALLGRVALGNPGRRKVYIIDEVHMLSTAASNALLKTLESPPAHVVFVLATTDPQKVLPTIRSRTQPFEFRLLGPDVLGGLLADVNAQAGLGLDPATLDRVVRRGNGSPRDALSALDQAAAVGGAEDEPDSAPAIVDALADHDVAAALVAVAEAVSRGRDPLNLTEAIVEHLRSAFLLTMAPALAGVPQHQRAAFEDQARRLGPAATVRAIEVLGTTLVDMREALDTRVTLEVALVRLCVPAADTSPAAIVERLELLERRFAANMSAPPPTPAPPSARSIPGPPPPAETGPPPRATAPLAPVAPAPADAPPPPAGPRATLGGLRPRPTTEASPVQSSPPPPSPAMPAAAAVGAATLPVVLDRDELTRVWGDQLFLTMSPGVRSLYRTGRWLSVDGAKAVFVVPTQQYRDRADEKRAEVEAALSAHFGGRVVVRVEVDGAPPASPASPVSAASPASPVSAASPASPPLGVSVAEFEEDLSAAEVAELEVAPGAMVSAESSLFEAFPGTEEVTG